MVDPGKRTRLQHLADTIRRWQQKGHSNEEIKKMLEHPVWKPLEKLIKPEPRKNGRGDWMM
jgi:hypothetical protein